MTIRLMMVLAGCTAAMCLLIAMQMRWYGINQKYCVFVALTLVLTGVYGSELWYYVENLKFGGRSFYGAVYFAPLSFLLLSWVMKTPYHELLDFSAPAGCFTLAMVKINCLLDGCCEGKILYINENHMYVRFPSQLAEMADFLSLSVILFLLTKNKQLRGKIFPIFLLLYGSNRFVLDFFRDTTPIYPLGLTQGSFWSAWAFLIGIVWLIILFKKVPGIET